MLHWKGENTVVLHLEGEQRANISIKTTDLPIATLLTDIRVASIHHSPVSKFELVCCSCIAVFETVEVFGHLHED